MDIAGLVVRITATYVFLLLLLRLANKRGIGEATPFDLVVALALGDLPDDVIWGDVPMAQGIVAFGAIMTLHLAVAYASFRSAWFDRLLGATRTTVMRHGRTVPQGLATMRMNEDDVDVQLRHQGRDRRAEIEEATIEPTGQMSIRPTPATRAAQRRDLWRRREPRS
jgi:uncharacterized membrane protein YcaP (DUF421 family)